MERINYGLKIYRIALEIERYNAKLEERPIDIQIVEKYAEQIAKFLHKHLTGLNLFTYNSGTDFNINEIKQ